MVVKVENITQQRIEFVRRQYGTEFVKWVNGSPEKYRLTAAEIQAKVDELVGDRQFLIGTYEPLGMTVNGYWSPSQQTLSIGIGGGDNWSEEVIDCKSLAGAERLMARTIGDLATASAANL